MAEYMESPVVVAAIEKFVTDHMKVRRGAYVNSEDIVLAFMCSIVDNNEIDRRSLLHVFDEIIKTTERLYYECTDNNEKMTGKLFACVEKADKTMLIINLELTSFPSGGLL